MRRPLCVAVSLLAALCVAGAATAAKPKPWTRYVDKAAGFSITIPTDWGVVPRTPAQVKALVAKLKKRKQTDLAKQYQAILDNPATRKDLSEFEFQAFLWPAPASPVETDVQVRVTAIAKTYEPADLPAIGKVFARQFKGPGRRVSGPKSVELGAGRSVVISGTVPLGKQYGGAKTAFTLYLFVGKGRLYQVSFRTDSRSQTRVAPLFALIARNFDLL